MWDKRAGAAVRAITAASLAAVFAALSCSHGQAEDFTNATNAAWCLGVLNRQISSWQGDRNADLGRFILSPLEAARLRHFTFADGYRRTGQIHAATLLAFTKMGEAAIEKCRQQIEYCGGAYPLSVEDGKAESSRWRAFERCIQPACERTMACSR